MVFSFICLRFHWFYVVSRIRRWFSLMFLPVYCFAVCFPSFSFFSLVFLFSFIFLSYSPFVFHGLSHIFRWFYLCFIDFPLILPNFPHLLLGYLVLFQFSFPLVLFYDGISAFSIGALSFSLVFHWFSWIVNGICFLSVRVPLVACSFPMPFMCCNSSASFCMVFAASVLRPKPIILNMAFAYLQHFFKCQWCLELAGPAINHENYSCGGLWHACTERNCMVFRIQCALTLWLF